MTFVFLAAIGVVIGYLVGRSRGIPVPGAVIGAAGAVAAGVIGNLFWGSDPIVLSLGDAREAVVVISAATLDVAGAVIGAGLSSLALLPVSYTH